MNETRKDDFEIRFCEKGISNLLIWMEYAHKAFRTPETIPQLSSGFGKLPDTFVDLLHQILESTKQINTALKLQTIRYL